MINEDAFDCVEAYLGIIDSKTVSKQSAPVDPISSVEYGGDQLDLWKDLTVKVYNKDGEQVALPILKKLTTQLGISHFNNKGGVHNTRQLGYKDFQSFCRNKDEILRKSAQACISVRRCSNKSVL